MRFELPPPPEGCVSVPDHERAATAMADAAQEAGLEMLRTAGGDRIQLATAKELLLAAVRARKVAAEMTVAREASAFRKALVRHEREMAGLEGPRARPRLRRKS